MQVLVFKTNLMNANCIQQVAPILKDHPHIHRWNVDLQDCDNILRIETEQLQGKAIEDMVTNAGFFCEELE